MGMHILVSQSIAVMRVFEPTKMKIKELQLRYFCMGQPVGLIWGWSCISENIRSILH